MGLCIIWSSPESLSVEASGRGKHLSKPVGEPATQRSKQSNSSLFYRKEQDTDRLQPKHGQRNTVVPVLSWFLFCWLEYLGQVYPPPHINISFVCESFCFVLHVASKGDKARVIWSTMKRTGNWFSADPAVLKGKCSVYQEVKHTVTVLNTYPYNSLHVKPTCYLTLCFLTNAGYFIKCSDFCPGFQC